MKFYLINKVGIEPKDYHIAIPFDYYDDGSEYYSLLVNLTENKLREINLLFFEYRSFQIWNYHDHVKSLHKFLKSKHTFIKTNIDSRGFDIGINVFDLNADDIMYIKLLQ